MEKSRERKTLEAIIKMVDDGKTIVIEPDFGMPYTIRISSEEETFCHTHSSYVADELDSKSMKGYMESLMNHILKDGGGLSWHCVDIKEESKGEE